MLVLADKHGEANYGKSQQSEHYTVLKYEHEESDHPMYDIERSGQCANRSRYKLELNIMKNLQIYQTETRISCYRQAGEVIKG